MTVPVAPDDAKSVGPEGQLILLCTRARLDDRAAAAIRERVRAESFDWERLLGLAYANGVKSLLYASLKAACLDLVPPAALDDLQRHFRANAARNLRLTSELLKILDLLEGAGIPAVTFKGPLLAATAYHDVSKREFMDLDIMIHESDLERAETLLAGRQYRHGLALSGFGKTAYRQSECAFDFARGNGDLVVEVHWGLMPRYFTFPYDLEQIWGDLAWAELHGAKVRSLSTPDLVIFLCLHGAKHRWEQLRWIADVAEIVRTQPGLDWADVLGRAERLGGSRMLLLGLYLAASLLDAPVPAAVLRRATADRAIRSLAGQVRDRLFGDEDEGFGDNNLFYLRAMDSAGQRLRYCANLALIPTKEEIGRYRLPAPISFLYYPLHPLRLLGQAGREVAARGLAAVRGSPAASEPGSNGRRAGAGHAHRRHAHH